MTKYALILCTILSFNFAHAALNDAEIAAIVLAANQVDVTAGKVAQKASKTKGVVDFANEMVSVHSTLAQKVIDLAKKLKVTPVENDISKSLKTGGGENIKNLKALKGNAFDKAYVDHEIEYHETVIGAIKNTLLPQASNAELKQTIESVVPILENHLKHAKDLQKTMK